MCLNKSSQELLSQGLDNSSDFVHSKIRNRLPCTPPGLSSSDCTKVFTLRGSSYNLGLTPYPLFGLLPIILHGLGWSYSSRRYHPSPSQSHRSTKTVSDFSYSVCRGILTPGRATLGSSHSSTDISHSSVGPHPSVSTGLTSPVVVPLPYRYRHPLTNTCPLTGLFMCIFLLSSVRIQYLVTIFIRFYYRSYQGLHCLTLTFIYT